MTTSVMLSHTGEEMLHRDVFPVIDYLASRLRLVDRDGAVRVDMDLRDADLIVWTP